MVEINLMPERTRRNIAPLLILILLILFTIILSVWLYNQYQLMNAQLENESQKLSVTEQLLKIENEKQAEVERSESFVKLKNAVQWTDQRAYSSVAIISHLTELLPERGFFLSAEIGEENDMALNVQFDTSKEAAYYLQRLKDSKKLIDVQLLSLSAASLEEQGNNETVPRYVGKYELTFDSEKFPRVQEEGE